MRATFSYKDHIRPFPSYPNLGVQPTPLTKFVLGMTPPSNPVFSTMGIIPCATLLLAIINSKLSISKLKHLGIQGTKVWRESRHVPVRHLLLY